MQGVSDEPGRGSAGATWRPSGGPPPQTLYKDSFLDLLFIAACRQAFGRVAGWQFPRAWEEGYLGMVEVSHALMRGAHRAAAAGGRASGGPMPLHSARTKARCVLWGAGATVASPWARPF